MKWAGLWIGFVLAVMAASITWGFVAGSFWEEGAALLEMPWGVITIIDVYAGATLFLGWIAFRERSVMRVLAWAVALFVLGNLATAAYALNALITSGGHATRFWMGKGAAASQ